MIVRWIILLYILKIHVKAITSQHHHHHHYHDDNPQQYQDEVDPEDSDESSYEYITRRKTMHRTAADSEECYCNCDACFSREGPKPCCTEFCKYCRSETDTPNHEQYADAHQEQKVVFVPFPYPLIVPNAQNDDAATEQQPEPTTTTTTTTTSIKPPTAKPVPESLAAKKTINNDNEEPTTLDKLAQPSQSKLRSKSVEVSMLSRHRQVKQLNPAVKRSRPAWIPKYGIVPIPDHLAAKLMTQLTEVRALKAKRL